MQAIETKFLPATKTKDYRIKATCAAGSLTVDKSDLLSSDVEEQHIEVAVKLANRFGWPGPLATGCLKSGNFAHVFIRD